jgi:hypothetical protein
LRALKSAFETLTPKEPYLPPPDSPIPALLALRNTAQCIKETQECISETETRAKAAQKRLEKEKADLKDALLIQKGLKARTAVLQQEEKERTQKTPGQVAKEMIRKIGRKQSHYDEQTAKLVAAFNAFIDEHLAVMLAAEELGGPIVGEMVDVDQSVLDAGFSSQGKTRKAKKAVSEGKRQQKIDEIWGPRPVGDRRSEEPWNEQRAAGAEMRELTEQLLNNLVAAGGGGPGAYVELPRESAAARFLVRAKVAQFHPKDARKLRLVDFGGEIED